MRLALLAALVMAAFAANSLLNRAAVGGELIGALPFALIRVTAGAIVLALIAGAWRVAFWRGAGRARIATGLPALWLCTYLIGFSLAYQALDAGIGALILFGSVQITMLAGAWVTGEALPPARLAGGALALCGLAGLLLPGAGAVPALGPGVMMAVAGAGWGLYSLAGRKVRDPLRATATNFALATPLVALATLPQGFGAPQPSGIALAVVGGALTSGLGYALWYAIVPQLGAARAAVAQLSVPVLALAGGAMLLAEVPTLTTLIAAGVVLFGVALASLPRRKP